MSGARQQASTMPSAAKRFRFGPYELRTVTQELYKGAIRVKLRPQAWQALLLLLERSGDVVSRDELRQRLWPVQPYVDFEHGLNTAIMELRGVLNDSAAEPRFIETLPRLGYRMIVPVTVDEPSAHSQVAAGTGAATRVDAPTFPAGNAGPTWAQEIRAEGGGTDSAVAAPTRVIRGMLWVAAAVVIAATGFLAWYLVPGPVQTTAAPESKQMLAVLPFENLTGDASQDYFSDGLTEEMIGQLGQLDPGHLGVIGRNSVMRYKTNHESTDAIGRELGVSYLLEGSVRRDADKVRVSAELVRVGDKSAIWSREYDRQMEDVLALQSEIAREIAGEIHLTLNDAGSNGGARAQLRTPAASEAYDLYLRGLYFWNKRNAPDIERAMNYFQQSVEKDPTSARAYAALADSDILFSGYADMPPKDLLAKAHDAARRAVELDDKSPEAHAALAVVAQDGDWDWGTAEQEYRRAIDLNPNYATAHHWYGEYLGLMGRFDESRAEFARARQLDPLSLIITADYAVMLYYARDYDNAITQFRALIEMEPGFPRTGPLPYAYLGKGMNDAALARMEEEKKRGAITPWFWAASVYVDSRAGKTAEARAALAELIRMDQRRPIDPLEFVRAYTALGDNDQAIAWLRKAHAAHSVSLTALKVEPAYDPLRSDPRFVAIIHEMNFPQ
jgi:TolB-like protein/DNA-binding winged helix-turn-helix (wHTH) protein